MGKGSETVQDLLSETVQDLLARASKPNANFVAEKELSPNSQRIASVERNSGVNKHCTRNGRSAQLTCLATDACLRRVRHDRARQASLSWNSTRTG